MYARVQRLDPDMVLKLCKKFQGFDGATKALAEQGLVNPDTGKPFTKNSIAHAARKADGFAEWRKERDRERKDVATEFARIARLAMATKRAQQTVAPKKDTGKRR